LDNQNGKIVYQDGKANRSYIKLEMTLDIMRRNNIGIYLLQETWEEGNRLPKTIDEFTIFHHNYSSNGKLKHLGTGVAIMLNSIFYEALIDFGLLDLITTKSNSRFEIHFIRILLKILI